MSSSHEEAVRQYHPDLQKAVSSPTFLEKQNQILVLYERARLAGGELILPLRQIFDPNIVRSGGGACAGYVLKWSGDILTGQAPFGIPLDAPAYDKVIPELVSLEGAVENYTSVHCVEVTSIISDLQDCQGDFRRAKLMRGEHQISLNKNSDTFFAQNLIPNEMARDLVERAQQAPGRVYEIALRAHILPFFGGHAAGFYQDGQGNYHYVDANLGWFRFPNATAFHTWFPEIFNLIYSNQYVSYELTSYGGAPSPDQEWGDTMSFLPELDPMIGIISLFSLMWSMGIFVMQILTLLISRYCSSPQPPETPESTPLMTP